ncbi:unnamed protein product [Caenorhabditis nigoni]
MSLHDQHCVNCITSNCKFAECVIRKCNHCHIPTHLCKLEEHITEVCRRAPLKCPNAVYGCPSVLSREKVALHLRNCPANTVVCSRDRCRKLNIKESKLQLKHMGRRKEFLKIDEADDLDIQLAAFDQNSITDSYNSSRTKRVKQRDPVHPAHPLIPLRFMPFDATTTSLNSDDSSEDEMREKREKLKKSRMVFANCYMCQIDPSVQHLHTLGNGADIEKLKKRRRTPQVLDKFHEKMNLKVSIAVENAPESTLKSENIREIKKGGTLYTLKCLKTVKRSEYGAHCLSQHTQTIDQMNEIVLRCPNWTNGCDYSASRVQPKTGKLRFQSSSATFSHLPEVESRVGILPNERTFENLPLWVYETLSLYLPSSSLYNLSLTSRKLRDMVFIGCRSSCYVEPVWRSEKPGSWIQKGFIWKISSTEKPPLLEWRVPIELSMHISNCPYFDPVTYEKPAVPVFPNSLESAIWNEFADKLSERVVRAELAAMID